MPNQQQNLNLVKDIYKKIELAKDPKEKNQLAEQLPKFSNIILLKNEFLDWKNKIEDNKAEIEKVKEARQELLQAKKQPEKYNIAEVNKRLKEINDWLNTTSNEMSTAENKLKQFERLKEFKIIEESTKATAKPALSFLEELQLEANVLKQNLYTKIGRISDKTYEIVDNIYNFVGISERHRPVRPIQKKSGKI